MVKSLGWEIIHQDERRAWIGACYWRLCGSAACSQWVWGQATADTTAIQNIWTWTEIRQLCRIGRQHAGGALEGSLRLAFHLHFPFSLKRTKNTGPNALDRALAPPWKMSWIENRTRWHPAAAHKHLQGWRQALLSKSSGWGRSWRNWSEVNSFGRI